MNRVVVALIGQPNVGKSTLFNALTHGNVIVTNWPGTTVEKHEGKVHHDGREITIVDLPGVYGLSGLTIEEKISRDFILRGKPDMVIVLVDSLMLSRTLYLAMEILELTGKVIIAVTKIDEAHRRGVHINYEALERHLGVPVVPVAAAKNMGLNELLRTIVEKVEVESKPIEIDYGGLEVFIDAIIDLLDESGINLPYEKRWLAVKLLEGDADLLEEVKNAKAEVAERIIEVRSEVYRRFGSDPAALISKRRFELAEQIARSTVIRAYLKRKDEKFVKVFYNPVIAPFISVLILMGIFVTVFTVNTGYPLNILLEKLGLHVFSELVEEYNVGSLLEKLVEELRSFIYSTYGETALTRFLVEGVFGGFFALLIFIPLIAVVLAVIAVFEDVGLLTRMAVGFHILLRKSKMSGHALFPISLSFGCNVPGIIATRSNPNILERIRMILLLPFIPCQARLVVLLAMASAIGGLTGVFIIPLAYVLAFAVVTLLNMLITKISEKRGVHETAELLLELPPLHKPIPRVVWWFTWYYLKHFIVKVGTIIIISNTLIWLFSNVGFNLQLVESVDESIGARVSGLLTPLLAPLGVHGDNAWMVVYALIVGFIVKELFLTAVLTVTGMDSYVEAFNTLGLSKASLAAIAIFVALYVPCVSTIATIYFEAKHIKYAAYTVLLMLVTAYFVSVAVYHLLLLLI